MATAKKPVEEATKEEAPIIDKKPSMKERIISSRPVKFVQRHKAGVIAGVAATAAAGAAAVLAAKGTFDAAEELPFDADTIKEALPLDE